MLYFLGQIDPYLNDPTQNVLRAESGSDEAETGPAQGDAGDHLPSTVLRKVARNDASRFTYGDRGANFT